jgi:hypothetical protein
VGLFREINTYEHLYLDRIIETDDLEIEFWIVGTGSRFEDGIYISESKSYFADAAHSDLRCLNPSTDRIYRVKFEAYIAVSVFNESFDKLPRLTTLYSRLFQKVMNSAYLDYVSSNADIRYAESIASEKLRHYRLNCLNHAIDVATCFDPVIEIATIPNTNFATGEET